MVVMLVLIVVALYFVWQGISMHRQAKVQEEAFNALQAEYFINSKAVRDAGETGSEIQEQLVEIQQNPSQLLFLKLVGVGNILTGIFIVLLGILMALMMMPVRLGKIVRGQ